MYIIRRIGKRGVIQHQRHVLANALWLALHFLNDDSEGFVTTLINTETSEIYIIDGIRNLAAKTPAWEKSSFDAPDIFQTVPYNDMQPSYWRASHAKQTA